jgi:hypothetical protein
MFSSYNINQNINIPSLLVGSNSLSNLFRDYDVQEPVTGQSHLQNYYSDSHECKNKATDIIITILDIIRRLVFYL